jgi:hypothetical protein
MLNGKEILAIRVRENGRGQREDQEAKGEYSRFHTSHLYIFLLFLTLGLQGLSLPCVRRKLLQYWLSSR